MMIQESMRLKVLILPLSLVIAVIVVIFFIKPDLSETMSFKDALADKQVQLETLKSQSQKLQAMKTKWDAMADEQNLVATAFPETEGVDSYISEITSKASRSGVLLTDIKLDQKNSVGTDQAPDYICNDSLIDGLAVQGDVSSSSSATTVVQPATASSEPQSPATVAAAMPDVPGASDASGLQASSVSSSSCLKSFTISLTAKGSWEQMLDFFKYLEDMNRISNIGAVTLSVDAQSQDQAPSDILSADISANAFFKEKAQSGNMAFATSLASQGGFNQNALEKLKETIYAPYDVPAMSPSGERNIFK